MTSPPPEAEAQRFARSQTPESPRPVHLPEPANILVLRNQMDPVFNDTATYNIPNVDQPFSFSDPTHTHTAIEPKPDEHDAVQDFLRGAEAESSIPQEQSHLNELNQADPSSALAQPNGAAPGDSTAHQLNQPSETTHPAIADAEAAFETDPQPNGFHPNEKIQEEAAPTQPHQIERVVDYHSLLDTVSQSASTAPAADAITAPTTAAAPSDPDPSTSSLPSAHGLPPKPPVQEQPADYADYQSIEPNQAQTQISLPVSETFPPASVRQAPIDNSYPGSQATLPLPSVSSTSAAQSVPYQPFTGQRPWSPRTQLIYDQFLEDERGYVTEGIWDKFPLGSRLFVGNLPSEKVTKRDLFHIFHRHGKLAQISIKQAYGFVQFLEAPDCYKALQAEQGVEIRGRKIHLEISKPQKNTRNAASSSAKSANARRRSRSPDRRGSNDRFPGRNPFGELREDRRREDFRRTRSPSPPRNYRSRDDYRPPGGRSPPRAYTSPRSPAFPQYPPAFPARYDEDAALPLSRRAPQDIPDVQLLILDQNVPQAFINWVENAFRAQGLKASTIWLSPSLPLQAVIKRQILEGVHAIVKLLQMNSISHKLPLQVFDRSSGASNVKFNEYVDLDINVAADIINHTKRTQASPISPYPPTPQTYNGVPQYQPQPMQQSPQQYSPPGHAQFHQPLPQAQHPYPYPQQPPYAQPQPPTPASTTSNTPNLQQLLANLRQPSDSQSTSHSPAGGGQGRQPDLGGLLTNIAAHQRNQQQQQQQQQQPQVYHQNPPSAGPPAYGQTPTSAQPGSNVQNIMEQLARYQR